MVVAVAGIDRDVAAVGAGQGGERVAVRGVGQAEGDHGAGVGPQGLRVGAFRLALGEPAHVAVLAGGHEGGEARAGLRGEGGRREAHGVEAEGKGAVADEGLGGHGRKARALPWTRWGQRPQTRAT